MFRRPISTPSPRDLPNGPDHLSCVLRSRTGKYDAVQVDGSLRGPVVERRSDRGPSSTTTWDPQRLWWCRFQDRSPRTIGLLKTDVPRPWGPGTIKTNTPKTLVTSVPTKVRYRSLTEPGSPCKYPGVRYRCLPGLRLQPYVCL